MLKLNELYLGNCLDLMQQIDDKSIDLIVTSPPYDNLRTYNGTLSWNFEIFKPIAAEIFRIMKDGGVVVWIVNDATINGSETGTSFKQALYFKELGFNLHDTMIWQKISPFQHDCRYIQAFEYMFIFCKGELKACNLIKDRKNIYADTQIHGTERQINGNTKALSSVQKSKTVKPFGSRYNIWDIVPVKTDTERTGHPAQFPLQLASDHVKTWSNEGDIVLDPFIGSGTTAEAAYKLGRYYIGMEKDATYFEQASALLAAVKAQISIFDKGGCGDD